MVKKAGGASFLRNVGVLTIGNLFSQGINIAGIMLLSHVYSPENFGLYAVVFGLAAIVGAVSSLRLEMTILLPRRENLALSGLVLSVIASLVINLAFLAVLSGLILAGKASEALLYSAPVALMLSIINISAFLQNRRSRYYRTSMVQIFKSLIFVIVSYLFAGTALDSQGLMIGLLMSVAIPGLALMLMDFREEGLYSNRHSKRLLRYWFAKNIRFLKYTTPAVLVNNLAMQLPVFALSALFGSSAAGYYSMISRILMGPVTLVSGAVNRVYMRVVAEKIASGEPVFPFTFNLFSKFLYVSIVGGAFLTIGLHFELLELFFGQSWSDIDALAMIMVPVFLTAFISKSIAGFAVLGKNREGLSYQVLLLLATGLAILAAHNVSNELGHVFVAISVALTICYMTQAGSILSISRRLDLKGVVK